MARLNKQDLVIKGNQYFKYLYKVEAIYFSGKRSLYYTKLDDVKRYVNKYVGKNDNLYLVNIHRYDVKSIMFKYMAEYKQFNLAYLLFVADRDNVFTFVTGWNSQGWINGGIDALEEIEQPKEEQKEIEQPKEEQEPIKEEQPKEKYFTVVKDGEILTRENNFQDCIDFIRDDVEKSNATTFEYIVKMHHDIIEVVAVVNKNNLYIYRDTRNKTIENNDVIKDIFVVNDENIYDNINDAVNDSATDKAIDFYTLSYRTTGAGVNNIDKKRWVAHCYLLISRGELIAFELTSNNKKTQRRDITMIKQLVFYARRLTAGVNIQNEINKKYKELSK